MTLVAFNPSRSSHFHGMYVGDRRSEQSESRIQIEIYVVDMNDNEPYFEKSSYNVTVHEDTLPGTAIFQVRHWRLFASILMTYSGATLCLLRGHARHDHVAGW